MIISPSFFPKFKNKVFLASELELAFMESPESFHNRRVLLTFPRHLDESMTEGMFVLVDNNPTFDCERAIYFLSNNQRYNGSRLPASHVDLYGEYEYSWVLIPGRFSSAVGLVKFI